MSQPTREHERLQEAADRRKHWKRWGPYLSERQWGTVREDYSADGSVWDAFPHDHARSRTYRWGEDGLLGITDTKCRLCFALALWNERDPILKERLYGLTNHEGNHGEDVKECYYYLNSSPTHSYMKALYRYPQSPYPYRELLEENGRRGPEQPEYELLDTGIFDDDRYFDVYAEYAKASPNDILIQITLVNRGPESAPIHLLPTFWFRNTWSWGRDADAYWPRPSIQRRGSNLILEHESLGRFVVSAEQAPTGSGWLFTENETNHRRLFNAENRTPHVKDAFHDYLIRGNRDAVNPDREGTKAAPHYRFDIGGGERRHIRLRLSAESEVPSDPFDGTDSLLTNRRREADHFYDTCMNSELNDQERSVSRQAYAGLLWTKQFYWYDVDAWLEGDPDQPDPPEGRRGRNHDWDHIHNMEIISMPDKWEYPWYAAWDLAFHMVPFARMDPDFAKQQLVLFLREWYMHPNGAMPAYEFAFSDVNPPVHAWAVWKVYNMTRDGDRGDTEFLSRCFQKLALNFTWWVNRKDREGENVFSGGFLGLDNIGVFDRSREFPGGGTLEQADGTAWMGFYCGTMLAMALELARWDEAYEDMASKFFEHYIEIADAINTLGGNGLWDEKEEFYYDHLRVDGKLVPLRVRSLVGLLPLTTVQILDNELLDRLPGFTRRLEWFQRNEREVIRLITCRDCETQDIREENESGLLALPSRDRLEKTLEVLLDEDEFLSDYGIRSLSKCHEEQPFTCRVDGESYTVGYEPGESEQNLFGGNSNWRGPIWFPTNFLIIESLKQYHDFYGDSLTVEFPTGSGRQMNLQQVAQRLCRRMTRLFLPDEDGRRPCHGSREVYAQDPDWKDKVLFYEYFHAETGRGCGASHQTGWTALVTEYLEQAPGKTID